MGFLRKTQTYRYGKRLRLRHKPAIWQRLPLVRVAVFLGVLIILVAPFAPIAPLFHNYKLADSSGSYAASGVIGQFNAIGGAYSNFIEPTNQNGMGPNDVAVDTVNHRLIIDDGSNSRILIYNLDNSNNLISTTPSYVLGQPDANTLTTGYYAQPITQSSIGCSSSMAFDQANERLFVSDECDSRVLVFDLSGGITNNMNASHVLGEPNFTTGFSLGNGESDAKNTIKDPYGLAYDPTSQDLFVADYNGNRVLMFDLSSGISDGMNASHVFGEPDFTTQQNNASPTINASLTLMPSGVAYDAANKLLYVSDSQQDGVAGIAGGRVLVFDLSGTVTDGMAASHVLGQPNFTSDTAALTQKGMDGPGGLFFDSTTGQLFVDDASNDRVTVFNTSSGIADGMNASFVLGEPNFTTRNLNDTTINGVTYSGPGGFGYDPTNHRLYLSDSNSRVLSLDLSSGVSNDMAPTSVLGQTDANGNPTYTSSGFNDEGHYLNRWVNMPIGTYVDSVHHLLYVADNGFGRVMVYPLDNNDNLAPNAAASYVLGQPNFTSTTIGSATQTSIPCAAGMAGDPSRNLLFVDDYCDNRILVYDTSNLSNGMGASYVIGQTTYTGTGSGDTQSTLDSPYGGITYDPNTDYLYVGDSSNNRVMVFDTSPLNLASGMNASYVLGQSTFGTKASATSQSGLSDPEGLTLDAPDHELFVADNSNARVMVFNIGAIGDGMNASNELGEPDFNTPPSYPIPITAHTMEPQGLAFDPNHKRLFVEDAFDRTLIFDASSGISNDMDATGVIGQSSYTSDIFNNNPGPVPSQYSLYVPGGLTDAYDASSDQLYVSELYSGRVMVFSFAHLGSINTSPTVGDTYSQVLGSGAQGATSYALTSGTPPTGLTFNSSTGLLSGTVTTPGSYSFTVKYTDNNGTLGTYTDSHTYNVTVSNSGGGGGGGGGTSGSSSSGGNPKSSGSVAAPVKTAAVVQPPVSIPPVSTPATIYLDQHEAYTDGSGYTSQATAHTVYALTLTDPSSGASTNYGITVQSIDDTGPNGPQVVLQVGPGGQTYTLSTNQTQDEDINGSGHNNVGVQVVAITPASGTTPATVTLKFWKLTAYTQKTPTVVFAQTVVTHISWFERLINGLTNYIRSLPNIVVQLFPYLLFLLLAIEATLLFRQAARELREYRLLQKLLARARNVDDAKRTFIELASHYLRTPVTILLGGLELLASGKGSAPDGVADMQAIGGRIRQMAESLVANAQAVEQQTAVGNMAQDADPEHVWRKSIIFVPVLLNLIVWIAFIWLANRAGRFSFHQVNFAVQVLVFVIVVTFLYLSLRTRQLRRRDRKNLERIMASEEALHQARDRLIADTVTSLQADVKRLDTLAAGFSTSIAAKPIKSATKSFRELLDKFVMASHLRGSFSTAPLTVTTMGSISDRAVSGVADQAGKKDIAIHVDAGAQVTVRNQELISYVLLTLLSNAVAYSKEHTAVDVGVSRRKSNDEISVSDQGPGIPASKVSLLFEPFSKAEGAEQFSHEGMGFSLYLDKLIMLYLGGDIALESQAGKGTKVMLQLPKED